MPWYCFYHVSYEILSNYCTNTTENIINLKLDFIRLFRPFILKNWSRGGFDKFGWSMWKHLGSVLFSNSAQTVRIVPKNWHIQKEMNKTFYFWQFTCFQRLAFFLIENWLRSGSENQLMWVSYVKASTQCPVFKIQRELFGNTKNAAFIKNS